MRVLITSIGSGGDVHPFLAIGRELSRRGHEVEVAVNPVYEGRVRAAVDPAEGRALRFRAVGTIEQFREVEADPRVADRRASTGFILDQLMRRSVPDTIEAVEASVREFAPDVILRHHVSVGSRWIAQKHGIPCVTGVLAPVFFFSRQDIMVLPNWPFDHVPAWVRRLRVELGRWMLRLAFDRPLNRMRREIGLRPERDAFMHDIMGTDATLGLWSPHFRGAFADDPERSTICGFAVHDVDPHHEVHHGPLERFLDRWGEQRPIVFSLGTIVSHHGERFYRAAMEAATLLERPAILLGPKLSPSDDSGRVLTLPYAPYSRVLPRAGAMVHHGGIGTTAQCLRAGVPMVIVPHIADQYDHAARVRRHGLGTSLDERLLSGHRLAEAVRAVLDEGTGGRARELARRMEGEDGARVAAELVEAAAARPRTS